MLFSGQLLLHRQYDELYQVAVQPVRDAATLYPNRPASPGLKERRAAAAAAAASSQSVDTATASAGPAAYVPPHLRGRVGGEAVNVVSAMIAGEKGKQAHKRISQPSATSHNHSRTPTQSASKHTTQRHTAPHTATPRRQVSHTADNHAEHGEDGRVERKDGEEEQCQPSSSTPPSSLSADSHLSADVCERRLRAALKKQRQIAELLERRGAGQQLDRGQEDKVRAASEVEAEVERLSQRLEQLKTVGTTQ